MSSILCGHCRKPMLIKNGMQVREEIDGRVVLYHLCKSCYAEYLENKYVTPKRKAININERKLLELGYARIKLRPLTYTNGSDMYIMYDGFTVMKTYRNTSTQHLTRKELIAMYDIVLSSEGLF